MLFDFSSSNLPAIVVVGAFALGFRYPDRALWLVGGRVMVGSRRLVSEIDFGIWERVKIWYVNNMRLQRVRSML